MYIELCPGQLLFIFISYHFLVSLPEFTVLDSLIRYIFNSISLHLCLILSASFFSLLLLTVIFFISQGSTSFFRHTEYFIVLWCLLVFLNPWVFCRLYLAVPMSDVFRGLNLWLVLSVVSASWWVDSTFI